jgi:signal transduction histidine kinase/CheY-like chemotaxis protein
VALSLLIAMGVNDALVAAGVYDGPYLVDLGFLMPMAAAGYALTARFVGDARALAALRRELEAQVEQRTAELSRTQEALHRTEKLAAIGQFAAGVAHEVNNPSAVLSANLQYLSDNESEALSPSGRDAVRDSLVSVRRISTIVRQLLDAGRLAASSTPSVSLPARALAQDALSVARVRAGRRHEVQNQLPEALWVLGQESVLVQVIVNLVVNALQAIPDHRTDGRVVIRAEVTGDRVRLVVEDNGPGMPPEVLRRAFEPFFTTKPFGSGTGLGLAVSRGLVTGMGGDLRLESQVGAGTCATVELPASAPPLPAAPAESAVDAPDRPRLQLLVVDDEPAVLASIRRLLEPRYGVEVAADVDSGLEHLAGRSYDLVLCDVMMPGGGGERLFRTLRERSPSAARRVVFLTGGAITEGARRFLHEQPQPVLYKPLELHDLAVAAEQIRAAS